MNIKRICLAWVLCSLLGTLHAMSTHQQLLLAAANGQIDDIPGLLDAGAGPHVKDAYGFTPLHYAAKYGRTEVVTLLIQNGAVVDNINTYGLTPLYYAINHNHSDIVRILLQAGASNQKNDLIQSAAQHGYVDIIQILLEYNADSNAQDKNGNTALHRAASYKRVEALNLLLQNGARVNSANNFGETALHLAVMQNEYDESCRSMIQALLRAGAHREAADNLGWAPVHYALLQQTKNVRPNKILDTSINDLLESTDIDIKKVKIAIAIKMGQISKYSGHDINLDAARKHSKTHHMCQLIFISMNI